VDYVIFDGLRSCKLDCIAITYDIWCKWSIHAQSRAAQYCPPGLVSSFLRMQLRGFVPKLHLYAHSASCRTIWSLNYHVGVGRTDGESTERDWAAVVYSGLQTGEMNYASRHLALDNHWCDKNFQCLCGLSLLYLTQLFHYSYILREPPSEVDEGCCEVVGNSCCGSSRSDLRHSIAHHHPLAARIG
jgi:hypothetical protein